jgi:hypothetical protein
LLATYHARSKTSGGTKCCGGLGAKDPRTSKSLTNSLKLPEELLPLLLPLRHALS